jgi:hypothetical protein
MLNLFDNNLTNFISCFIVAVSRFHQQMHTIRYKPYVSPRNSYVPLHQDTILRLYKHKGV